MHHGDILQPNVNKQFRLFGFININSLPCSRGRAKNFDLEHLIADHQFSHMELAEVNINHSKLADEDRPPA
eukprot:7555757-Ditylum_brightwellii.AAC.1